MPGPLSNEINSENRVERKPATSYEATPRPCLGRRSPSNRTRGSARAPCDKELLRQKCLELERVEQENRKFQAELKEAELWGEEMLKSSEEKERQWAQERAQLTKPGSEDIKLSSVTEFEEALAAANAKARAESIKAEAFQESLAAAREALQKKAREKNAAEAEAAKATEAQNAAESALEAALAEQEVASKKAAQQAKQEAENAAKATLEAQKNAATVATKRANELQKLLEEEEKAKHDALQEEKSTLATVTQRANELERFLEAEVDARKKAECEAAKANAIAKKATTLAEDQALSVQESKEADKSLLAALRADAEKAKAQAEKERTRCAEAQAAWKSALATQEQLKSQVASAKADAEKACASSLRAEEHWKSELQVARADADEARSSAAAAKADAENARQELDKQRKATARKCEALEEDIKVLRDDLRKRKKHTSSNAKDEFRTTQGFSAKHVIFVCVLLFVAVLITFCMCQKSCIQSEVRTNFDVKVRFGDAPEAHQKDASEHFRAGLAAMQAEKTAEATKHANRAFKLDPKPEHAILLARVFAAKELKADALRVLNKAMEFSAKSSAGGQKETLSEAHCALHNNAGILLAEMGNAEHAVEQLRKAVSCADGRAFGHGLRLNLANAEMQHGQWSKCAEEAKLVAAQQVGADMQQAAHVSRAVCLFRNGAAYADIVTETRKAVKALPSKDSAKSICANLEAESVREFAAKRVRLGKARPTAISYKPRFWYMQ